MASLKVSSFCFAVTLFIGIVILLPTPTSTETVLASHYESYTYSVTVGQWNCYTYYYTYCYNWWYWNYWYWDWYWYPNWYYGYYWNPWYYRWGWYGWCDSYPRSVCYYTYTTEIRTGQRCVSGWIGSQCNVPTCTPACQTGMICADLNKCGCADGSSSASCQIQPCSPTNNCYPGTCVGGKCKCPAGFSGDNCLNFAHKPSITSCRVQLFAKATSSSKETQVADADCAAEGLTPSVTWINGPLLNTGQSNKGLTTIIPTWTAEYTYPSAMPAKPQGVSSFFIKDTPVRMGLLDGGFNISFPNNSFETTIIRCSSSTDLTTLPSSVTCSNWMTWDTLNVNSLIGHNVTMIVQMRAVLGGKKTGDSTYTLNGASYGFGDQSFNGTPVVVQSMLKFDLVPPSHCVLTQSGSRQLEDGRINCTVFPIYLDQDIRTNPVIKPLFLEWTDDGSGISRFHVEMFYMKPDVTGEQLEPNGQALTDSVADITPTVNNYQYTVPTPGVYSIVVTAYDYANNSATARKIFNYNNRPSYVVTDALVNIVEANPLVNYSFISSPLTNSRQLTLNFAGKFQAESLYQTVLSKRVRPLPITSNTIDDMYGSQFGQRSINAVDNQTGISSYTVRYLVDSQNGGLTALPTDTNNTATISGERATLVFDNPLKDGDTVIAWLTAIGSTGNQTTYQLNVGMDTTRVNVSAQSFVKNGKDQYTSRVTITAVDKESGINSTRYRIIDQRSGISVIPDTLATPTTRDAPNRRRRATSVLQTPCSSSDTTCYCTQYRQCFAYEQVIEIDNCKIDRFAEDKYDLVFQYWITNRAGIETSINVIALGDITGATCRPTGLSGGAIAGIVIACIIGFLILVVFILLLVLIFIRIRQNKHPIPNRQEIRTMYGNARQRFTMRNVNKHADNDVYVTSEGNVNFAALQKKDLDNNGNFGDNNDSFKISKKQIQVSDELAKGKFAVVRRAYLMKTNSKETVAAKALKNGSSDADRQLMAKKIIFMKTLPPHANLVKFIGYVDDTEGEGSIMILELCDYPLKDWLANVSVASTDVLEHLLNFTLNIAHGVAHLHSCKIIHRRLMLKNVLLRQQASGLVAKLIGFGPSIEDEDNGDTGSGVSRPLKWLAPETLDSVNSKKPVYNESTDAWSFGVAIWEMYSLGVAPYADVSSNDIRMQLKRGLRLQCPLECPPDLFATAIQPCWKEKPSQRPSFSSIIADIQKFRTGFDRPQSGYYGSDDARGSQNYYNNAD